MEPPITIHKPISEVEEFVNIPLTLPGVPCNTQAVESVIPLVTKVSKKVANKSLREGAVRNVQRCRKKNPKIECKRQFKK